MRSTDGGTTWSAAASSPSPPPRPPALHAVERPRDRRGDRRARVGDLAASRRTGRRTSRGAIAAGRCAESGWRRPSTAERLVAPTTIAERERDVSADVAVAGDGTVGVTYYDDRRDVLGDAAMPTTPGSPTPTTGARRGAKPISADRSTCAARCCARSPPWPVPRRLHGLVRSPAASARLRTGPAAGEGRRIGRVLRPHEDLAGREGEGSGPALNVAVRASLARRSRDARAFRHAGQFRVLRDHLPQVRGELRHLLRRRLGIVFSASMPSGTVTRE